MPKYIFVDGVMKLDPTYQSQQAAQGQPVTANTQALAVISSTQDIQDASQAQQKATGKPMQISEATVASMEIMQDPDYLNKFKTKKAIDGGDILDGLSNIFAKYEVPIGLMNKLLALTEYNLNFMIDDSGSMREESDLLITQACPQVKKARDAQNIRAQGDNKFLTRWEEAEDRLHILIDMLSYLPIDKINISFFNNKKINLTLSHAGKTPEQFAQEAHQKITESFNSLPKGKTPIYQNLSEAFNTSNSNTMHYVFTDGEPSDATVEQVKELILRRRNPKMNPVTLMSCTNNDEEAGWMKEIEEVADFTSELDDFNSERKEVLKDQGPAFPFTRGFWLICQLVAAINPHDLDAMDESVPFTKKTMNDLLGRNITIQEYRQYFQSNPNKAKYLHLQQQFEREDILAHHITHPQAGQQNQQAASYPQAQPYPNQQLPAGNYPGTFFNGGAQQPAQPQAPVQQAQPYPNQQPPVGNYPGTFFNGGAQQPAQPQAPAQQPYQYQLPTGYPPGYYKH